MQKRLFIVDDDADILFSLKMWFTRQSYDVMTFSYSKFLLEALYQATPDIILLDVNLHNEDGREICKNIKEQKLVICPVVLFSADPSNLYEFKKWLADGAIEKPYNLKELTRVINTYLQ